MNHIREIEKAFAALQTLTNFSIIWKTVSAYSGHLKLKYEYSSHTAPFCVCVKNYEKSDEKPCVANDDLIVTRKIFESRSPFVHVCHAGASELIIPFFDHDRYIGTLFCGPFRQAGHPCTMVQAAKEFSAMPELTNEHRDALITLISLVVHQLLPLLEQLEEPPHKYLSFDTGRISDERIASTIRFMELNFKKRITLTSLAHRAAVSESHFSHLFHSETGTSFRDFLLQIRLREACRLLHATDLSVGEIAWEVGIASQSRLAAQMKRNLGVPPLAYRRISNQADIS